MPFYAWLSKKIALPTKVRVLSWNLSGCGVMSGVPDHDAWLAAGGDDAMLRVLKIDAVASGESNVRGVAAQTQVKGNNPLEGHKSALGPASASPPSRAQRAPPLTPLH